MRSSSSSVHLDDIVVHHEVYDHGVQLRTHPTAGSAAFGMIVDRAPLMTFSGVRWLPQEIAVSARGELDLYAIGPSSYLWVDVAESVVQPNGLPHFSPSDPGTLRPAHGQALEALRAVCMAAFALDAAGKADALAATAARDAIVQSLRSALAGAEVSHASQPALHRHMLVQRAEDYMWENLDAPLDLERLARAAGCGVRKLLYCFNRTYGMGPLCYFKIQRLNAVRLALESDTSKRTILDVAADYGFWHLGHFGVDYKSLFGMTPSETRRAAASGRNG